MNPEDLKVIGHEVYNQHFTGNPLYRMMPHVIVRLDLIPLGSVSDESCHT